jgi:hypothetical protein
MPAPPTTLGVVGARLRLHAEELFKQHPVGLDPHKGLTEVDEHRNVEDLVGVEVQVLDTVVLEEAFEEVARRESQPALDEPRKHWDLVGTLLHWIWISRSGAPHVHFLLAQETAVHQHQQVFGLCLGYLPLLVRIRARRRGRRC